VTLSLTGIAFLTVPHGWMISRMCFTSAVTVLVIKVVLNLEAALYPKIIIAVLGSIVAGVGVNKINNWVTSLELDEASKPSVRAILIREGEKETAKATPEGPHNLPPLIRQGTFSTVIPFAVEDFRAGIPSEFNPKDPLALTYVQLSAISDLDLNPETLHIKDAYAYVFVINMDFQWNGDRQAGAPYADWAQGLFSGLQKKLVAFSRLIAIVCNWTLQFTSSIFKM